MAKKKIVEVAIEEEAAVEEAVATRTLEDVVTDLEGVMGDMSIRQLCIATDTGYNSMLKASKQPITGQVYDPDSVNYRAMIAVMVRKMGVEDVVAFNWTDAVEAAKLAGDSGVSVKIEIQVGDVITLRDVVTKDGEVVKYPEYTVHIVTPTHIVIMPTEGSTQPRVMSNSTFNHCGGKKV